MHGLRRGKRDLGIHVTVKSILRGWGALCVYKAVLIRDGCGYTPDHDNEDSDLFLDKDGDEDKYADGRADVRGACLLSLDNTSTGQQGVANLK